MSFAGRLTVTSALARSRMANGVSRFARSSTLDLNKPVQMTKRWNTSRVNHNNPLAPLDTFVRRHIGPRDHEVAEMLGSLGYKSMEEFTAANVPKNIRKPPLRMPEGLPETEALTTFRKVAQQNKVYRSYIGMGYHGTITPPVILRNVLENPGWYTPYTPYQAEISQGRLESLLNFQTLVKDLTGLDIANASLLDEGTAAAEAMNMAYAFSKKKRSIFFVSRDVHPQTIALVETRAEPLGVKIVVGDENSFDFSTACGVLLQYPGTDGRVVDFSEISKKAKSQGSIVVVATDLLSLTVLKPPGEFGADIALGSAQRFGVPAGYGGPHAAFFATRDELKRIMPGRLIGVSRDSNGQLAYRMALQTREQHIRRETATSNICTAQALLANMASMYAVYHGPEGLKDIALRTHTCAQVFAEGLTQLSNKGDFKVVNSQFFDTVKVEVNGGSQKVVDALLKREINVRKLDDKHVSVAFDETVTEKDLEDILLGFSGSNSLNFSVKDIAKKVAGQTRFGSSLTRTSPYLTHPVFNTHHSETEMLRYLKALENKDLSLCNTMIPLGSCTMKLNATTEMIPITWPELAQLHPFVPANQAKGYHQMFQELSKALCEVTGFAAVSLQPNSGSQGEYAGLSVIRAYLRATGQTHRNVCLIPVSAHGTNPASAAMVGMRIVPVKSDSRGNVDLEDLKAKAAEHSKDLACLMVTYPSTHGVFEEGIKEICSVIHQHGGQVYMDGANMNSQVGLCSPGEIGADVCHLNLHKTFCIPHGGGGPGMGPIGVAAHLAPFLPTHPVVEMGEFGGKPGQGIGPISAAPFGSSAILPISHLYIKMMGGDGLTRATQMAILNANYMAQRLREHYSILYAKENGLVAHEFILDFRPFQNVVSVEDVAKRLIDYGFHAPTMAWPIPGTLMVEPTESEPKAELDRFCDALIQIREEIRAIEEGRADKKSNVLSNAPHTAEVLLDANWNRPYSREQAAYPLPSLRSRKYWPTVGRLDNVFGDRNLICSCPSVEETVASQNN